MTNISKFLIFSLLSFSLVLASDIVVWQGQYYTGSTFNIGSYQFDFNIYDNETGGTLCYTNTSTLSTGTWGQWSTYQHNVSKLCNDSTKDYWLDINISATSQGSRRLLRVLDFIRKDTNVTTTGNITASYICDASNCTNSSWVATSIVNFNSSNATANIRIDSVNSTVNSLGNWSSDKASYYNSTSSDARYFANGQNASIVNLTVTGNENITTGNLVITAGNITYTDRNGKTRVIQDTTQGMDEFKTNTLLDKSRSTLACSGGTLNYTLVAFNGVGEWNFNGTFYGNALAVPSASILLLNGTNTTPKTNYVYFYLNSGTPTMAVAESQPTGTVINVATFVVGETVGSNCVIYAYNRNREEIDSFINRLLKKEAVKGTLYESGFSPTVGTVDLSIGTGYFFNNLFEMYSTASLNTTANGFYYINSTGNFIQVTSLDNLSKYEGGTAVTNNKYINLVWGVVPINTTGGVGPTQMRIVVARQTYTGSGPSEYSSVSQAEQDLLNTVNYYPANTEIKKVFTPIARTIVQFKTAGGTVFSTLSSGIKYKDLRGQVTSGGGAPAPSVSDHAILSNLAWSTAGHTMDASLNMVNNSIINASYMRITPISAPPVTCNSASTGSLYFDSDIFRLCACNSTSWVQSDNYTAVCS